MSPQFHVTPTGDLLEDNQSIGLVQGLQFTPISSTGEAPRAITQDMREALDQEYDRRLQRIQEAVDDAFVLSREGIIRWLGEPLARLMPGAHPRQPELQL